MKNEQKSVGLILVNINNSIDKYLVLGLAIGQIHKFLLTFIIIFKILDSIRAFPETQFFTPNKGTS